MFVRQSGESREKRAVEECGDAESVGVRARCGSESRRGVCGDQRGQDFGGDEGLVAYHQDEGLQRWSEKQCVRDTGTERAAYSTLPLCVVVDDYFEIGELFLDAVMFGASDDHYGQTASVQSCARGTTNQRLPAILQELLGLSQPRGTPGREDDRSNLFHAQKVSATASARRA